MEFGCLFCVGRYRWLTGCSGVGDDVGSEGASSGSAGLVAVVYVWRLWLCEKSGQVCCCSFGGEIRSRCGCQCPGLRWCVLRKSRMQLGVNDTAVL